MNLNSPLEQFFFTIVKVSDTGSFFAENFYYYLFFPLQLDTILSIKTFQLICFIFFILLLLHYLTYNFDFLLIVYSIRAISLIFFLYIYFLYDPYMYISYPFLGESRLAKLITSVIMNHEFYFSFLKYISTPLYADNSLASLIMQLPSGRRHSTSSWQFYTPDQIQVVIADILDNVSTHREFDESVVNSKKFFTNPIYEIIKYKISYHKYFTDENLHLMMSHVPHRYSLLPIYNNYYILASRFPHHYSLYMDFRFRYIGPHYISLPDEVAPDCFEQLYVPTYKRSFHDVLEYNNHLSSLFVHFLRIFPVGFYNLHDFADYLFIYNNDETLKLHTHHPDIESLYISAKFYTKFLDDLTADLSFSIIFCSLFLFLITGNYNRKVKPSKFIFVFFIILNLVINNFITSIRQSYIGLNFIPFIFALFSLLTFFNLIGLLPFSFCLTSYLTITGFFSLSIITSIIFYLGFNQNFIAIFSFFAPADDTPLILRPLLIIIEVISFILRVISLAVRLCANMLSGHILMHVIAESLAALINLNSSFGYLILFLPIILIMGLFIVEFCVCIIQSYVFSLLVCIYLNEAFEFIISIIK